jgi:hypothetical protein
LIIFIIEYYQFLYKLMIIFCLIIILLVHIYELNYKYENTYEELKLEIVRLHEEVENIKKIIRK